MSLCPINRALRPATLISIAKNSCTQRPQRLNRPQFPVFTHLLALLRPCCFKVVPCTLGKPHRIVPKSRPSIDSSCHVQVAFDPLDGSSIIAANFAVGTHNNSKQIQMTAEAALRFSLAILCSQDMGRNWGLLKTVC